MEDYDEYDEIDYPELGYQDSMKEPSEEVSYGKRADMKGQEFQGKNWKFFKRKKSCTIKTHISLCSIASRSRNMYLI